MLTIPERQEINKLLEIANDLLGPDTNFWNEDGANENIRDPNLRWVMMTIDAIRERGKEREDALMAKQTARGWTTKVRRL